MVIRMVPGLVAGRRRSRTAHPGRFFFPVAYSVCRAPLHRGVFRNPLADPFLLGSASGATLAIVLVLAGSSAMGVTIGVATAHWLPNMAWWVRDLSAR